MPNSVGPANEVYHSQLRRDAIEYVRFLETWVGRLRSNLWVHEHMPGADPVDFVASFTSRENQLHLTPLAVSLIDLPFRDFESRNGKPYQDEKERLDSITREKFHRAAGLVLSSIGSRNPVGGTPSSDASIEPPIFAMPDGLARIDDWRNDARVREQATAYLDFLRAVIVMVEYRLKAAEEFRDYLLGGADLLPQAVSASSEVVGPASHASIRPPRQGAVSGADAAMIHKRLAVELGKPDERPRVLGEDVPTLSGNEFAAVRVLLDAYPNPVPSAIMPSLSKAHHPDGKAMRDPGRTLRELARKDARWGRVLRLPGHGSSPKKAGYGIYKYADDLPAGGEDL